MKHVKPQTSLRFAASLILASALLAGLPLNVGAASGTWTNNASGYWSTAVSWNPNGVPGTAAGDVVSLNPSITANRSVTNDLGGGVTLGVLNIGATATNATLTLADQQTNSITFNNSGSGAQLTQTAGSKGDTISASLVLAENLAITNASTNNLALTGIISGSKAVSISSTNGGNVYFSPAQIRPGSSSGTTTIVTLANTAGLQTGMGVTGTGVASGAYIVSVDTATQITLNTNATNLASVNLTFSGSTFSGGCTLATNAFVRVGGSSIIAGGVVKSGPFGTGNLTFSGSNTLAASTGYTVAANQINYNGDLTLGVPGQSARIVLQGTNDFGGATRTIYLVGPATNTLAGLNSGKEALQFNVPPGAVNGRFQNGNLVIATTNTGVSYGYFRISISSDFINNAGLTLNDHVLFTSGAGTPFTTTNPPTLTVNSGAIFHTDDGNNASRTINLYSLAGSGIVSNGSSVAATSPITLYGGTATFAGVIADNPTLGKISVTKNGAGSTQTFTGVTTYSGQTTVTAGTLVNSTLSTNAGYAVSAGATLGAKVMAAGTSLGMTGLTNAASSLLIDLNGLGLPTAPVIVNTGNNTVNGTVTVNLTGKGSPGVLQPGTFTVISNGSATRSTYNYVLGSLPPGVNATLADNTNLVTITITSVATVNDFVWTGAADTNWNTSSLNWQNDSSPSLAYTESPSPRGVIFDDSASGGTAINLAGTVSPTNVLFANATKTYTLTGPGKISGATGLKITSAGAVNLATANDYTGQTIVGAAGASLVISNAQALGGSGGGTVLSNNATLRLGGNITVTGEALSLAGSSGLGALSSATGSSNVWTGNITVTENGARLNTSSSKDLGVLKVSGVIDSAGINYLEAINVRYGTVYFAGANTYLGSTVIANGIGVLDSGNNRLPIGTVLQLGFGVNNAGTLDLNGWNQELSGLQLYNGTNGSPASLVTNSSATLSTLTINADTNATIFGGIVAGNLALTKLGTNIFTLTNYNAYTGSTVVGAGTLAISQPYLAAGSTVAVSSGAVLDLNFGGNVTNAIAALVLNGVSQPGGVYSAANASPYLGGTGYLLVPGSSLPSTGTNITFSASNGTLTLSWPANYTGWELQSNAVNVADTNFWHLVTGSTTTNQMTFSVDVAKTNVFFRMHHP